MTARRKAAPKSRSGPTLTAAQRRAGGRPVVSLSLTADALAALDALAATWGCSRSEAVARLVRERGGA